MGNVLKDRLEEPLEHVLDPKVQDELGKYENKWVALTRSAIIAVADDVGTVREMARREGVENPILYHVPEPDTLFIL